MAPGATWCGPGRNETGASWAHVKGAARHLLLLDLAFKQARGVHLNWVLKVLFRGPVVGLLAMSSKGGRVKMAGCLTVCGTTTGWKLKTAENSEKLSEREKRN